MAGLLGNWRLWVAVVLIVVIAHLVIMKVAPGLASAVGASS